MAAEEVWYDAGGNVVRVFENGKTKQEVSSKKPEWLNRESPQGEPVRWDKYRMSRRVDGSYVIPAWYGGYRYPGVVYECRDASYWESSGCNYHNRGRLRYSGNGWSIELRR